MKRLVGVVLGIAAAMVLWNVPASSFVFLTNQFGQPKRWESPNTTINLRLGDVFLVRLTNFPGHQYDTFNQAAHEALNEWSTRTNFAFSTESVPSGFCVFGDGLNTAQWGTTTCSGPFQPTTLAVTYTPPNPSGRISETEVVFNLSFPWNAYDGPLVNASVGCTLQDLHRTALHEFGHSLGLGHPDQAGQFVTAIMHSIITSEVYFLTSDDIDGANGLYQSSPVTCECRAGTNNFCFYPFDTPNCPMTAPGGYCTGNPDWQRGFNEYVAHCGPGTPPGPPPSTCPCRSDVNNFCFYPFDTPNCSMTAPGGYCTGNPDWQRGFNEYQSRCHGGPPPGPPPTSCECRAGVDNFCFYPFDTPNCSMTAPGGYCTGNPDWQRGFAEYQAKCGGGGGGGDVCDVCTDSTDCQTGLKCFACHEGCSGFVSRCSFTDRYVTCSDGRF